MLLVGKFELLILFWVNGRYAPNPCEVYGFLVVFWVFGAFTSDPSGGRVSASGIRRSDFRKNVIQ